MRNFILLAWGCLASVLLSAQHTNYFFKTLNAERGATMCLDPDGNLWAGVREQGRTLLIKMKPDGTVLDRAYLNIPGGTGTTDNLAEILVDSDGMVVGCGNSEESYGSGFIFRYNPANRTLLWAKTFEIVFSSIVCGIVENEPGGHFIMSHAALGSESELIYFDRTTGTVLPNSKTYRFGGLKSFNAITLHKGSIYTTGIDIKGPSGGGYLSTSKVSAATGALGWARHTPRTPVTALGDLIGQDIIVDNDSILSAVQGGPFNSTLLNHTLLHKNTLDGALVWAKRYALYSPNERASAVVEEVVSVADGYLLFGRTYDGGLVNSAFFLIKTDKKGQPQWARLLGKNWDVGVALLPYQNQVLATDDAIYIIADAKDANGLQRVYFVKTDLNGNVEGCDHIQTIGVQAFDLNAATVSQAANIQVDASSIQAQSEQFMPQIDAVPTFANLCEVKAACASLPDAALSLSEVSCANGARTARFSLCNLGGDTLRGDVALGFYPQNPLKDATQRVGSLVFSNTALAPGACAERSVPLVSLGIQDYAQVYALAGAADIPTPIASGSFPLGNSAVECNYANNVAAWKLDVKAEPLSIGPDRSICPGQTATLSAGPDAVGYLWQDGSTAPTFNATASGLYWAEMTDICGAKQRDSVLVTVLPTPVRSQQVKFVEGGSVTLGGTVYTQPGTVTLMVPSSTGGCDSLITYLLEWVPAEVKIVCPTDVVTAIPLGQNTAAVNYALPAASTNCPNIALTINRLEGPAPGSALGEGTVKVCYEATDNCNARSNCCFNVTVNPAPPPCETKVSGCVRYELFTFQQVGNSRPYRLRVVNNCASTLQTLHFQLPAGAVAASPTDGSVYTAPSGRQYDVRNASLTPFYSLRFKGKSGSGIPSGQSEYFEYKLPNQIVQGYFLAFSRFANGQTNQAHINANACIVEAALSADRSGGDWAAAETGSLHISPNPTSGAVSLWLPESWQGQSVRVSVLNAQGQLVQESEAQTAEAAPLSLSLDAGLSRGLYYLLAQTAEGQRAAVRCVLK